MSEPVLHIDFETRSTVDLKVAGVDLYARHPDTDIWCMGFAFGDEEPEIIPGRGVVPTFSGNPLTHVKNGGLVMAHNAAFELAIWNLLMVPRYRWPVLKPTQIRCTMAMAYAMGLPGALDKVAPALGVTMQKDQVGQRLMMQMSEPKSAVDGAIQWWDEPKKLEALYEYCKQDVRVEREISRRLLPLSEKEQAIWVLDRTINDRGVFLDQAAIKGALGIVQVEADRLNLELREVTGNAVGFTSEVAQLTKWVRAQGVAINGLAKADILDALVWDNIPQQVRRALLIRQEAGKTSNAKLQTMLNAVSSDGRVKDTMQYHSAHTGRWAGRRIQPHNYPRAVYSPAETQDILSAVVLRKPMEARNYIDFFYGQPLTVLSSCLRAMICAAPGNVLYAGDWSNIEGRVTAWLAGEEWKLQAFRDFDAGTGPDIYRLAYAKAFRVPVNVVSKEQRQVGKVMELALGYQGGVGAFQTMGRNYNVIIPDADADGIKQRWRDAHSQVVQFWYDIERAAVDAVAHPGTVTAAGHYSRPVRFKVKGSFLFCRLPSGRLLTYPYPNLKEIMTPWGELKDAVHFMVVDGVTKKWVETHTYGGSLTENVVQAVSRDILAEALTRLDEWDFPVVLHVHDEVVAEVPEEVETFGLFLTLMNTVPAWAADLPLAVSGFQGKRYEK